MKFETKPNAYAHAAKTMLEKQQTHPVKTVKKPKIKAKHKLKNTIYFYDEDAQKLLELEKAFNLSEKNSSRRRKVFAAITSAKIIQALVMKMLDTHTQKDLEYAIKDYL